MIVRDPRILSSEWMLLRLWLLGTWAAADTGKRFKLVNVVLQGIEEDVPSFAASNSKPTPVRRVHRVTWKSLDAFISSAPNRATDDDKLRRYLKDETLGYSCAGRLVRAFALDSKLVRASDRFE